MCRDSHKFGNFHDRIAGLVRQLLAQTANDKLIGRRTQQDLERRLVDQSRLFEESEREREHWRGETAIARKTEDDLRTAIIEIEGRANAAARDFNAEKAQLQAMLDRANGEPMRAKDSQAA